MVADFGKDTYGLSEQEAQEIAKRVREGDLTPVLRAWENDIKVSCHGIRESSPDSDTYMDYRHRYGQQSEVHWCGRF